MAGAKIPEDEVEYAIKRIRVELKEELDAWVKKKFSFVAFIVAIVSIFGPITLVKVFVGDEVNSELESWKNDIIKVQMNAEKASIQAEEAAKIATESTKKSLAELARLRASMAQTTGRLLERRGEISSLGLTEGDKAAILVRQIPRKTGEKTSQGNEWVELDFKLEIDASKTNRSSKEILNQVVKVEYSFDERWFRPPVRTAINPANGFEYSMRVWGVTEVKAVVHISLPDEKGSTAERRTEKIAFEGRMNLDKRGTLKRVKVSP